MNEIVETGPMQLQPRKLDWAFNSATVMPLSWHEEMRFWEKYGWRNVEIWWDKIEPCLKAGESLESLRRQMKNVGVTPIGMCPSVVWTDSENHDDQEEQANLLMRLDACAELGVPALTVCTFGQTGPDLQAEYSYLADRLRTYSDEAQQRGLRLHLEFIAGININGTLNSGIELINAVNHPALGLVFDLCHYYASASHFEDMEVNLSPEKLFSVHIDDARRLPMESLAGDKRAFPGEGRIDVSGLMKRLYDFGYKGLWTVELYDPEIWIKDPEEIFSHLDVSLKNVEDKFQKLVELSAE